MSHDKKPLLAVADYLVLGCLGLIDQGEIDWKVLALEVTEAKAMGVVTLDDFEKQHPGRVSDIREWFRTYKTLDGKPLNEFREDGRIFNQQETLKIVLETNIDYRELMKKESGLGDKHGFWLETAVNKL